ncbi:hypothetical protein [Clostridium sp.]|uniref:hypothetical protein n=1 Tax=Clostridium sp. TaxID=1506 RepID=UPI0025BA0528|nr:hypothetical protein [Clostridium sp.]MCI9070970.1 hypothetical protein [Clostridium sp.]
MGHNKSFKKNNRFEYEKEEKFKLSEEDIKELSLLNSSLISTYLFTISDIIFYESTINAIKYILSKDYYEKKIGEIKAVEAGYLELISKLILVNVDISRYNYLCKKNIDGKKGRLLKPELDITIGDEFQVLTYFFIYIGFLGNYNLNNIKDISIDSNKELSLMISQLYAINIKFYADYLAYIAILESIQLVSEKYKANKKRKLNPDIPAIQSSIFYLLSRVILANLAFTRYDELYKKYGKTQFKNLLQPSVSINVGNIFGIVGGIYILVSFMERYERNITGPIFGI